MRNPQRIAKTEGVPLPEGVVDVSWPGPLGNPFEAYKHCGGENGDWGVHDLGRFHSDLGHGRTELGARKLAVKAFRSIWDSEYPKFAIAYLAIELAGRDLACTCPLGMPCHADYLIEVVNTPQYAGLAELIDAPSA